MNNMTPTLPAGMAVESQREVNDLRASVRSLENTLINRNAELERATLERSRWETERGAWEGKLEEMESRLNDSESQLMGFLDVLQKLSDPNDYALSKYGRRIVDDALTAYAARKQEGK